MKSQLVLPKKIGTVEEARTYMMNLHLIDMSYHPEEDAKEVEWDPDNKPTPEQMDRMNDLMDQVYASGDFDPEEFYNHSLEGFERMPAKNR